MPITIRPFEAQDYAAIFDIYSRVAPPGIHPPEAEDPNSRTYVSVEPQSHKVVGFAVVPMKKWYSFDLVVSAPWQRQGIGRLLWEHFSQDLARIGATVVEPWVREENAAGIAWLLKHGFAQTKLEGPVNLFLKDADLSRFEAAVTEVEEQGVVLTTLTCERHHDRDCLAKLHDLYNRLDAEVRRSEEYNQLTLEQFVREQDEPEAIPDAYFIANMGPITSG